MCLLGSAPLRSRDFQFVNTSHSESRPYIVYVKVLRWQRRRPDPASFCPDQDQAIEEERDMSQLGLPPNRARRCRRRPLVLAPEHLADRLSPRGSGRTRVDRTMRSLTTISSGRPNGQACIQRSNRGLSGCLAIGQMDPEISSLPGGMTARHHQQERVTSSSN